MKELAWARRTLFVLAGVNVVLGAIEIRVGVVVTGLVAGTCFVAGAALRKATLAIEEQRRETMRREALLEEANADLDRVLHARAGPSTGARMGAWRLGELLGRGGMGEVYRATNEENGTIAAVKLLLRDPAGDPELLERFRREARALARVDHPNVVRLLDVGDGWIAMELLEGVDLAKLLRKKETLQSKDVLKLVSEVAAALEAARRAGIVHRDLKPQNIFFETRDERWKVLDFGLSKLTERGSTPAQRMPVGTPAYMAPEQIEGTPVDHRADVFALGLVVYRAITGRPAFSAEEPAAVLFDVLFEQPPRPSELAPVDIDVDFALALALAKYPSHRFERAIDLAAALESAYRGALSPILRSRAETLLATHGWGERRLGSVRNLPASLRTEQDVRS